MADTFTNNLRFILQTDMANVNQWGTLYNRGVSDLVEEALAGVALIDVTAANQLLTTNNGFSDTARPMFIKATGNPGIQRQIIMPTLDKIYVIGNETSPGFDVEFKTALNSGVTLGTGQYSMVWVDALSDLVRPVDVAGATISSGGVYQTVTPAIASATGGATTATVNYFTQGNLVHMTFGGFTTTVSVTTFELDFTGVGGVPSALIPGEPTSDDRIVTVWVMENGSLVEAYLSVPPANANWEFLKADGTAWLAASTRVINFNPMTMWQSITD